ncbi:MAG: hypothetical protein GXW96_01380 [Christensenellaceae bacterium]|nr:hypothetical protein [Christensenellaceae bacterium]
MGNSRVRRIVIRALALMLIFSLLGTHTTWAGKNDAAAIPDDALKQALIGAGADANGDGVLTERELKLLTGALDLSGRSIRDLTGLELASGVTSLNLSHNAIMDISALAALKNLISLDLSYNGIEDISGLSGLFGITSLNLSGNEISDISALYDIDAPPETLALKTLDISENYLNTVDGSEDRAVIDALFWRGCFVVFEPQKKIPVKGVALNVERLGMCPGDTATLHAAVIPDDAATQTVTWRSSDETVATVQDGVVTAVSTGTATITAVTDEGGYTNACVVSVVPGVLSSSVYTISDTEVRGVAPATDVNTFKQSFDNGAENLFVYDSDGKEFDGPMMATGMTVKLIVGGIERDSRAVVVTGDANGDGRMTIRDYVQLRLGLVGQEPLDSLYAKAGDYTQDGQLTAADFVEMRLAISGQGDAGDASRILPDLPEVSDPRVQRFLEIALKQLGKPYVWGARGPNSFDCSGFVYYCLKKSGYKLERWTADMYSRNKKWTYVDKDKLQPGDLMFYYSDDKDDGDHIGHTGIYLGNGYHIHASSDYGCIIICGVQGWYKKALAVGRRVFD